MIDNCVRSEHLYSAEAEAKDTQNKDSAAAQLGLLPRYQHHLDRLRPGFDSSLTNRLLGSPAASDDNGMRRSECYLPTFRMSMLLLLACSQQR